MDRKDIRRIAVFTSGGDAPGMNAALRAVVRTAAWNKLHVYGIERGFEGMIDGHFKRMERRDVANIIQRGGTVLRTARSKRFMTPEGRAQAAEHLRSYDIDACIAIGGNGTFTGAKVFSEEHNIPFIGIPGTIDNDLFGTDYTIGFDTAVNTAIDAVDKIRDTADSHNRLFLVEVMGRNSGFIALHTAIGSGASSVLIPEAETNLEDLKNVLKKNKARGKLFSVVIVAEGHPMGGAAGIAERIQDELASMEPKVTVIGHLQRGGAPTALDRLLASRLGHAAVNKLMDGEENVAVGIVNSLITTYSFDDAIHREKKPESALITMASILAI
ncbi:6-phosphofructokinase [Neolewinella antarctica]|uniref:ATP-dependent 6-phosphofructokinase n=1 Tax=Neolewinella antarctica TaxID=442734 RepID=A0ABX0X968_9BACT|nr:6-phosphofructokinase [Neolewinella antarctica]NJC25504.1 6-phosphofructokinase 1 [Neolewinella antarctica]